EDRKRVAQVAALKAAHGCFTKRGDKLRVFGETFVGSTPTLVLGNRHAGREGPIDSGGAHLLGSDARGLLNERGVAGTSHSDLVREEDGSEHIVVPMHSIHAVKDRNAEASLERLLLEAVIEVSPGLEAI